MLKFGRLVVNGVDLKEQRFIALFKNLDSVFLLNISQHLIGVSRYIDCCYKYLQTVTINMNKDLFT